MTARFVGSGPPRFSESESSFEAAHAAALLARSRLEAAGFRVPPSGRFSSDIKQLALVQQVTPTSTTLPKKLDHDRLHRALVDTAENSLIAEQLSRRPAVDWWTDKAPLSRLGLPVRTVRRGSFSSRRLHHHGRGARRGIETPDRPVGIAAKRSHSWTNLNNLVAEADDQIRKTGHIGIVALDVSYLTNPQDTRTPGFGTHIGLRDVRQTLDGFLNNHHARLLKKVDPQRTIGVIVYACHLAIDLVGRKFSVARGSVFGNFCSLRDPNLSLFTAIRQRLTVAI